MIEEQFDKMCKSAWSGSDMHYGMFKKSEHDWKQDLKALGKTDEEILEEFITVSYYHGYMDARMDAIKEYE